jgi:hypothetical protein
MALSPPLPPSDGGGHRLAHAPQAAAIVEMGDDGHQPGAGVQGRR